MKRIISAGLCTAFILSLAGCARQDTTPSLTAADTTDTQMGRWVESRVDLGGEQLISYPTQLADGTIVLYTGKVGEDSIEDYTRRTSTDGTNWTSEPAAFDVGDAMVTWILVAPDGEQALITYDGENAGLVLQAPDGTKTVVEDDTVKQGINPNTAVFQGDKLDFVSNGDTVDFVQVSLTDGSVTTAALPQDLAYSLNSLTTVGNQLVYLSFDNNTGDIILNALDPATGASTIQQQINDTFSSVAADSIAKIVQKSAGTLTGKLDGTNSTLMQALTDTRKNLADYQNALKDFQTTVKDSGSLIDDTLKTLDSVNAVASSGSAALADSSDLLATSRTAIGTFSTEFSTSLSDGETLLTNVYTSAALKLGTFETKATQVNTAIGDSISSASSLNKKNAEILEKLAALQQQIGSDSSLSGIVSEKIAELQAQNASLQELIDSLGNSNSSIGNALTTASNTRSSLETLTAQNRQSLQNYRSSLNQSLLPQLNQSLDGLATLSGSLSSTLTGVNPTITQLKVILTQLKSSLNESADALGQTGGTLESVDTALENITADLKALQSSETYQHLISLEGIDSDSISDFMSSPVSINSKVLYDVENYGSGMTPFYTNLALWVGGLILVSILKQEVDKDETISRFTPTTAYFGRWMLFVVVGLIQGFIVCIGDLLLLKVQCVHPVAFVCAGMLCSFVYVNLIYAMALTFKHIGKALAVVLVILQIPGSSGTYPIEMTPVFFQRLHPLLPFSYGIGAMRECIAGFYKNNYAKDLLTLLLFLLLAFFIGLVLRPLLMNLNHLFDKRLAETDLMLGETATGELSRPQLTLMMKTMMQDEDGRADFIQRANRFEKRYPKLIRTGFILILVIPLIFLLLMFGLESKIVYLTLWIISLIVLAVYLICVEYIHDKTSRQLSYIHLSEEEFLKKVKEEKDE
mgnify:CR=1 FL=1